MNYLAIFKDSLREAIDTKVLYVTLALSLLVIVLVGSVRFRAVTVEEEFRQRAELTNWMINTATQGKGGIRFDVLDFEQTNSATEPWDGQYRFIYLIELPDAQAVQQMKDQGLHPDQFKSRIQSEYPWTDEVVVTEAESTKPTELRFQIDIKGSKVKDRLGWIHEPGLFFGLVPLTLLHLPLAGQLDLVTDKLVGVIGAAVTMLLSVIITAFFIPNMLRKGTVDLLLSKPIHRTTLLIYKYMGGLTFMFLNTTVIMTGLWFVLGLQAGVWLNGLLLCIFIFTFQFAIFYAVSTLAAVLTRSVIVAILASVTCWGLLFVIGWGYRILDGIRPEKLAGTPQAQLQPIPDWVFTSMDVIHFVSPRYKDLDVLMSELIQKDLGETVKEARQEEQKEAKSIRWDQSIPITLIWIAGFVGLACWRFAVMDY